MHILFLGCSKLIQNRILPVIDQISNISSVDIAKYKKQSADCFAEYGELGYQLFDNFQSALDNSEAQLVYISVVNSAHALWTEKSLSKGFHVIVDKPSVTQFDDAIRLVQLAKKLKLCLVESNVYDRHPQIKSIKDIFKRYNTFPSRVMTAFSFPPLDSDNFRYKKELGGGAILDTAPYAVSIGRVIFGETPKEIMCKVNTRDIVNNIELSYSLLCTYSNNRTLIGHFGFDTEYINRLTILGPDILIDLDRIFTTTATLENKIKIKHKNKVEQIIAPRGNSFVIFLNEVINKIEQDDFENYYRDLLLDAEVISKIKRSIEYEQ